MYLGIAPLGLSIPLTKHLRLVVDPLELCWPLPQLKGVPISYRQYRVSLGVEFYP